MTKTGPNYHLVSSVDVNMPGKAGSKLFFFCKAIAFLSSFKQLTTFVMAKVRRLVCCWEIITALSYDYFLVFNPLTTSCPHHIEPVN